MSSANGRHAIAFDGSILGAGPITGVGRSFLTTLRAYAMLADRSCVLLLPPGADDPGIDGVRVVRVPRCTGLARHTRLPRVLRRLGTALLHSPVAALPLRSPCPVVVTVHDLPWRAPEPLHEPGTGLRHRLAVRVAAHCAAAVVLPSTASRDDLLREVGTAPRARLHVVPHGVEAPESPADEAALTGPFLVLGDDRPRKNLDRIRRAHEIGRWMHRDLPLLKLVGPGFGYVSEDDKLRRLRGARALLQVSLFEGFGLPVLEAFHHGVPVLCSDRGSLPELAHGGAALVVDPTDVDAIGAAMVRIHEDDELRRGLRARGLERAAGLTPLAAAHAWLRIHREIAP